MGSPFAPESFARRHLGSTPAEIPALLAAIGADSLDELVERTIPVGIRSERPLRLPEARTEQEALAALRERLGRNRVVRSLIGQGYHDTVLPPVIQRNVLENPGWYTAYTPYQAEIAQGRLEALLNFQTMVCDLTGLDVANASLLDEGTAVAEAMALAVGSVRGSGAFFADEGLHPQSIEVLRGRAEAAGIELLVGDFRDFDPASVDGLAGAVVQLPDTRGRVVDYTEFFARVKAAGAVPVCAADPLSLVLITAPGSMGAEIAVGSTQRFGVPLGYGGPHAAYIAVADRLKRKLPGRIVGVSRDSQGNPGLRLALQTREQHIRRDKATSNICTAQVLLAVLASMYAVYHGPDGLRAIAARIHGLTSWLADGLRRAGLAIGDGDFFDAITIEAGEQADELVAAALEAGFNLGRVGTGGVRINLDERSSVEEVGQLAEVLGAELARDERELPLREGSLSEALRRRDEILTDEVFHRHHTETAMMRYLKRLESRDLALDESMIALGSCTMKLNAAAELMPLSWEVTAGLHPFAPLEQAEGWGIVVAELEQWLAEITGFEAVSLQPNAGASGEFAGLLAIRGYHRERGDHQRRVCLIPVSAHGTNPATAAMCGLKIVPVACRDNGDIDIDDLRARVGRHAEELAALMVTYPSTHGVFEEDIVKICEIVHEHGGQVYMDGANMNAQVGLTSPGRIGADVCHLNLHKTFAIPHGGGGPGVGPIGVAAHLAPHLPGHGFLRNRARREADANPPVAAAPFGSASILTISWMYLAMMGPDGLTEATRQAILNANYLVARLGKTFPVLYSGRNGTVAHECIIDLRPLCQETGVTIDDVAKRLIDYGFHAPTMSFPVPGTLMIEPTESENRAELDRFAEALLAIAAEMGKVGRGEWPRDDNPLVNSPHTDRMVGADHWIHPYDRAVAAWPVERLREHKFWPRVGRIDNVHGDRNLVCTCAGMDEYAAD